METSSKNNEIPSLKNKKLMLSTWGCGDKDTFHCRDWIPVFNKMFGKLVIFTSRNFYYHYGKEALNKEFLRIIQQERPDYLLFSPGFFGQFEIETLAQIKKFSPQTKTIIEFGDDDWKFEDWSRYYALFFDYIITSKKEISIYKKDKLKNVFVIHGVNPHFFKPLNLEKKYDVSFIGRPVADRYEYLQFLKENGVNLSLFGIGWQDYPDLKNIYHGVLYDEDYPRVINQSKINLNFSKTLYKKGKKGQLKGRSLEVPACNSFMLNEYTSMNIEFINKHKEINFNNKKELLEKINYFLIHEKEREKIAEEFYQHIIKNYSWEFLFQKFFSKIEKDNSLEFHLPKINKNIFEISKEDIHLSLSELKEKLKNTDYISFSDTKIRHSSYRNYLQSYSLFITKKQISCCDYFVHSNGLGDYMLSLMKESFHNLDKENFSKIIHPGQLMVTKNFFLDNLSKFREFCLGGAFYLINEKNTAFVSIPLISIPTTPLIDYPLLKKYFHLSFIDNLFSLFSQKKIFNAYNLNFLISFFQKSFIRKYLIDYFRDIRTIFNLLKTFKK